MGRDEPGEFLLDNLLHFFILRLAIVLLLDSATLIVSRNHIIMYNVFICIHIRDASMYELDHIV